MNLFRFIFIPYIINVIQFSLKFFGILRMSNTLVTYVTNIMTFWSMIGRTRVSKFCNLKTK